MTNRDDIKRSKRTKPAKNGKLNNELKDILNDAKDGRVKKSTQKKIKDILDEE